MIKVMLRNGSFVTFDELSDEGKRIKSLLDQGVRPISKQRARKLKKRGDSVWYSPEFESHVWKRNKEYTNG